MAERRWSKKLLVNRIIEYGVIASLALLFVLVMLPADEDAGDYSIHEPGKAHAKHHESALMSTVHHMEGQCGRFHALRSHPNMQLLDGTDKVVLVTGAAGFIGSHTARCVVVLSRFLSAKHLNTATCITHANAARSVTRASHVSFSLFLYVFLSLLPLPWGRRVIDRGG